MFRLDKVLFKWCITENISFKVLDFLVLIYGFLLYSKSSVASYLRREILPWNEPELSA